MLAMYVQRHLSEALHGIHPCANHGQVGGRPALMGSTPQASSRLDCVTRLHLDGEGLQNLRRPVQVSKCPYASRVAAADGSHVNFVLRLSRSRPVAFGRLIPSFDRLTTFLDCLQAYSKCLPTYFECLSARLGAPRTLSDPRSLPTDPRQVLPGPR